MFFSHSHTGSSYNPPSNSRKEIIKYVSLTYCNSIPALKQVKSSQFKNILFFASSSWSCNHVTVVPRQWEVEVQNEAKKINPNHL